MSRVLVSFSCGAPSAIAAKLMITRGPCEIIYLEVKEEHLDNHRFREDCERWLGQKIIVLGNDKYERSIYEVFRRRRYLVGIRGAPCTSLLKREVMDSYARSEDVRVLGYTLEEKDRLDDFREHFPSLLIQCPLIDAQLTKADCLAMIQDAGIELPVMYKLGFNNNNCIGCVKGGVGYWNKIRRHFPERFAKMAKVEREINFRILRDVFLDELDPEAGRDVPEPKIDCSILCMLAKQEYSS